MKKQSYFAVGSTLAIGIALLAVPLRAQFVYLADINNVWEYRIGPYGLLTLSPEPPASYPALFGEPSSVAVDPTGKFVYVADRLGNSVSAFSVGPGGDLTPIVSPGANPVPAGTAPSSVAADPTGRFVYVANQGSGNVSAYSIRPGGLLELIVGPAGVNPAGAGSTWGPGSVTVDPTGRFVYVTNSANDRVFEYSIGPTGLLTPLVGSPVAVGPCLTSPNDNCVTSSVVADPTGRFAYVANTEGHGEGSVQAYKIDSRGVLIANGPMVRGHDVLGNPASVAVDPTGKFVYANNEFGDISAFSIESDGTLKFIGPPSFPGFPMAVDPAGRFVYAFFFNPTANPPILDLLAYGIGSGGLASIGSIKTQVNPLVIKLAVNGGRADVAANKIFNNFTNLSQFTLNGSAHQSGPVLRLTDDVQSQAGSAFLATPILLRPDSSFSASFAFQISGINGSGPQGSDGMTFVIQSDPRGATALGVGGGNLGLGTDGLAGSLAAITPSIAIEFDTHQNSGVDPNTDDPDGNHVALIVDGNMQDHKALASVLPCPAQCLNSGSPIYVWVDYNGITRRLSVFLANQAVRPATPLLATTVSPLNQLSAHLNGRAFFGFTGGTGGGTNIHDVLSWTLTVPGMAGDINGDGTLGCSDLAALKTSLGKRSGQVGFNPLADANGDGVVDVRDLAFATQKLPAGTTCP